MPSKNYIVFRFTKTKITYYTIESKVKDPREDFQPLSDANPEKEIIWFDFRFSKYRY